MKPSSKITATFIFLLSFTNAFAQNNSDASKVNFIKAQYAEINSRLKTFKTVTVEDTAETTEGNEVAKYFDGNEIKKIKAVYYGETGKAFAEYYFFDKKLFFYYRAEYKYDAPFNANGGKVKIASVTETRYYFDNGRIFLVKLKPKRAISPAEYGKLSIETEKEAGRLMKL